MADRVKVTYESGEVAEAELRPGHWLAWERHRKDTQAGRLEAMLWVTHRALGIGDDFDTWADSLSDFVEVDADDPPSGPPPAPSPD